MSLCHAFASIKGLPVLTEERILPIRAAVEVRPAVEIIVLVVSIHFRITRVRVEIGTRIDSFIDTWVSVEKLASSTTQSRFPSIIAKEVISAWWLQRSVLVKPHFKVRTLIRTRLVMTLSAHWDYTNPPVGVKDLPFRAFVELDGDTARAFYEISASATCVDLKSIGFSFAEFVKTRRVRTIVERFRDTVSHLWVEDTCRRTSMKRRFPTRASDVRLAILRAFVGIKAFGKVRTLVVRSPRECLWRLALHFLCVVASSSVVKQARSTVFEAHNFTRFTLKVPSAGLRRVRVVSVTLSLTRWLVANNIWIISREPVNLLLH